MSSFSGDAIPAGDVKDSRSINNSGNSSSKLDSGNVNGTSSAGGSNSNSNSGSSMLGRGARSLSASTLKDALAKLASRPLHVTNPVAALQANVE